jgi:hypothetical protein
MYLIQSAIGDAAYGFALTAGCGQQCRQDFVAEAGAPRKSVGSWELFVGT